MGKSGFKFANLVLVWLLSSAAMLWLSPINPARAHEVVPSIADISDDEGVLTFTVRLNIEGLVAGIDLSKISDTNLAAEAASYDQLRALGPAELEERFRAFWPEMAQNIVIDTGSEKLVPRLLSVEVAETGNIEILRSSQIRFAADLPAGTRTVSIGWLAKYGELVIRQMGVEEPYDGYLAGGEVTPPIALAGGGRPSLWQTFTRYGIVGFDHIIPKGLDHVLFVLGLFFLSPRLRPLLWQISAFTLAHTVTLALAALGYVSVSSAIVEPVIALSIVYVAVENMWSDRLMSWRPIVVFAFGLLHGLGFASVLGEFGLPDFGFVSALIGFNVGVELGQLTVIALAFAVVGFWFRDKSWYRTRISKPGSTIIALTGAYWFVERTVL